jgi:hypothetical protein
MLCFMNTVFRLSQEYFKAPEPKLITSDSKLWCLYRLVWTSKAHKEKYSRGRMKRKLVGRRVTPIGKNSTELKQ